MKKFCRKGHLKRSGKRWLALLMSVCLIGTMIPITARAENGSTETGLCEHHTEHTTECGYAAPAQGHECGHVHDESCGYQEASECTHVHTEECGENGENCTHVHTSECGYAEGHACEHVHDEECGYAEASEGSPCTFVCDICGKEAEPEQTEGKLITSWQWIDEEEYLDEETGNLALPGASEQTPAYFDDVISFLPTQIQATVVNADDSENPETGVEKTISLGDWSCDSYPEEGAYSGNYTFSVALPEGYALSEEAEALTVLVELGGAQMWYDSGSLGNGLSWTLNDDGTLTICGEGDIPDANQWWDGQATSVKEIVIEEGVTGIGDMGLCQCTNLTSVTIPSTVTSIGEGAFQGCKSLTTVSFADECVSTLSIGGGAFYGCIALESIEIPDYVTTMGISTFRDCSSLQSVTFKEGSQLNAISDYAFYGCSALTSIVIPESVTTLGTGIFDYCSNLNKVTCVSGSSAESYLSSNYPDIPIARLYKLKLDLGSTGGYTITQADKTALPGSGLLLTDGDGSLSFRIEAAYGYNKNFTVKADGTEMTAVDGVYTISGITENKTIALTIEGAGQCSHNYNNGFCTKCDAYEPAVYNESQYYYEINNAGQLYWFAGLVNGDENICTGSVTKNTSANAVLTADITVNSGLTEDKGLLQSLSYDSDGNVINGDSFRSWTPIGNESNSYTGTFDGQGFTVSGLYVNNTDFNTGRYVGLFGRVASDGKVSKVGVVDSYFNAYKFVGGVCGYNKSGDITECYNKGTVNGNDMFTGGVCGDNSSGTIQNCYNEGSVTGKNERTGGVCGGNENASIINCYNTGKVAGRTGCGGVCGNNYTGGTIQNCYNIGTVSFSTTDTTGAIGGVCGYNKSTITNCYFDSDKYTGTAVGGTGDGSNVSDNVLGKTTEQFASGEVAYLLNGSSSENSIWYQNIDNGTEDAYPVLDSGHGIVYQCTNCTGTYSNTENKSAAHRFEMVDDTNHKCKNCGLVAEHSTATLTYTADEDTNEITVKCGDDCGKEYGTVTLRKPTGTLTYDGNAKEAVISNDVTGITISNPDITYKQDGNTLSSAPKDAGTYTASITLGAATVSVEFIIARATPALGHNYTSKVTTEPTTDREGVRTYTCDRCGHSYTESIPKLPEEPHEHSYSGSVTKEATCTDTGVRTYTCSCGDSYTETIPALGHSYTSKVTKEPTTSSEGVMTYTCDRCGHSYTRAIAKLQDNNNPGENQPGGENTPDIGKPYIKDETGKEGWEVIKAEVDKTKAGDTVTVEMNGSAVVPGNVLDEIKGKDADIVFDMGGGITWSVNGQSITSDKIGDIDFSVTIGTTTIPTDVINNVTGERQSKQISLAYDGEFGFTAVLSINMEASNAGMYANLYYYNEKTGELEFICADKIAEDGTAELTFTHASDYVIAIDTEPMDKLEQVTEPESESQSTEAESTQTGAEVSNDAWNPWWIIVIGIMVIVIGLGVFLVAKKKKEDELE